jgi:hypothetical protein
MRGVPRDSPQARRRLHGTDRELFDREAAVRRAEVRLPPWHARARYNAPPISEARLRAVNENGGSEAFPAA